MTPFFVEALNTPSVLDRLVQHTIGHFACQAAVVLVRQVDSGQYKLASAASKEKVDETQLGISALNGGALLGLQGQLARDAVVQVPAGDPLDPFPQVFAALIQAKVYRFMSLNRGGQPFGLLAACYSVVPEDLTAAEIADAESYVRFANMVLDYARVIDEFERISQIKSEFLANMSYELRTPLHVIMGYTDLLLEGVLGELSPEQEESLRHVGDRTRELLALITAILDLSQLSVSGMPEDVDVATLLQELDSENYDRAQAQRLRLLTEIETKLPLVRTDRMRLKVVLQNLIDNALKFTRKGSVTLSARAEEGGVAIIVTDTGIGIDPDDIPLIFEPFQGIHSFTDREPGKVRVGLYGVRQITAMLGGRVTVDSKLGRGSTFRVWLPLDATQQNLKFKLDACARD